MDENIKYEKEFSSRKRGISAVQSIAVGILSILFIFSQFLSSDLSIATTNTSNQSVWSLDQQEKHKSDSQLPELPFENPEDSETPEDPKNPEESEFKTSFDDAFNSQFGLNKKQFSRIASEKGNQILVASFNSIYNRSHVSILILLHSWKVHYS